MTEENDLTDAADVFNSFSSYNRIYTFLHLTDTAPKYIAEELDVTRTAIQHYINDWKELDLITVDGIVYHYTDRGEKARKYVVKFASEIESETDD